MKTDTKRRKCAHKGCKKFRVQGSDTCEIHAPPPPGEAVTKMTDIERLSLVNVETECMNIILQLRNHDLETEEIKRKLTADLNSRSAHREQLVAVAEQRKAEQQRMVKSISEKYGLDSQKMAYDPESGVLRDLSTET